MLLSWLKPTDGSHCPIPLLYSLTKEASPYFSRFFFQSLAYSDVFVVPCTSVLIYLSSVVLKVLLLSGMPISSGLSEEHFFSLIPTKWTNRQTKKHPQFRERASASEPSLCPVFLRGVTFPFFMLPKHHGCVSVVRLSTVYNSLCASASLKWCSLKTELYVLFAFLSVVSNLLPAT